MWFLYGELFVLMLVSFGLGSLLATIAVRLVVRKTADQAASEPPQVTPAPGSSP